MSIRYHFLIAQHSGRASSRTSTSIIWALATKKHQPRSKIDLKKKKNHQSIIDIIKRPWGRVKTVGYATRWVSIDAKLEGLEEPQRSQRLFEIMEGLQQSEPAFMEKVNRNMAGGYDGSQQ